MLLRIARHTLPGCALLILAFAGPAAAQPLDLENRRPRPVQVAIEISPPHLPARLDHHYSERGPAWLEPGPAPGQITVRIAGPDMERLLHTYDPVPGSFGDYVWVFDSATGHVVSARLDGAFRQQVDWGLMRSRVRTEVSARMTTLRPSGYLPPRARLGHVVFEHCLAGAAACNVVSPSALDPTTGYVNAVGHIQVRALGGLRTDTYSPLGEAVFTEMRAETAVSAR